MSQKRALITGASSGIGAAYARLFAEHGYDLIVVGRNKPALRALAGDIVNMGRDVQVLVKDLSVTSQVFEIHEDTQAHPVDVLVNNAGFGQYGFFHESDLQTQLDMISVNISAVTVLTKLYLKDMVKRNRGTIINVASTAAFVPVPLMNVYGATKSFVLSLTESIASELEGTNVQVMAVCPGSTESDFHKRAGSERRQDDDTKLMSARSVAEATYHAMVAGKRIVVPGTGNKVIAQAHRILPRAVLARIAKRVYLNRKH